MPSSKWAGAWPAFGQLSGNLVKSLTNLRLAVNLGDDTDTTAAVAGGLAGIAYGWRAIPDAWLEKLRGRDVIERCLFD
ncbi:MULTISPECIES: ADP-ribosylglycohydrolase family protein [Coriobacteriales]|uniref:ADP-ribosylglycohydrolase family protein n=1 Tax=Coriobacteriales TaxID=84999 RepID=UPI002FDE4401